MLRKQNNIIYHLQFINPTSKGKENESYEQSVRNFGKPTYVRLTLYEYLPITVQNSFSRHAEILCAAPSKSLDNYYIFFEIDFSW